MSAIESHIKLAESYFEFLARHFPVMCASDEFHFLPRSQAAANYYDRLDDLEPQVIKRRIEKLKEFQKDFSRLTDQYHDLEIRIDLQLLQANIAGILIELEQKHIWQYNPLLKRLGSKIDPAVTWQELYHDYLPPEIDTNDTIMLYREEIKRLQLFFSRLGFSPADLYSPVEISDTPPYLRSVRGAASFAAAFSADEREKSYFYITAHLPVHSTDQASVLLKKRFHREYKMLIAHETIPGHHFLDSIRRRLKNPVRRQIESPLFYEGWASYAEFLLIESGYVHSPMDLLVEFKRRLWRSARCQVVVGLATGRINAAEAIQLLNVCGFSVEEARRQIDRFRLNPGYQLCYSLGCNEFKHLKTSCGSQMQEMKFHTFLLEG